MIELCRIRYWIQDTLESGRWCLTAALPKDTAEKLVELGCYERAEIIKEIEP